MYSCPDTSPEHVSPMNPAVSANVISSLRQSILQVFLSKNTTYNPGSSICLPANSSSFFFQQTMLRKFQCTIQRQDISRRIAGFFEDGCIPEISAISSSDPRSGAHQTDLPVHAVSGLPVQYKNRHLTCSGSAGVLIFPPDFFRE